ncbi:LysR family transcriptional regulator [Kangiella sp. HZ709]|uniref:LysR family transcriptional regulator n=1 Tax=Kangiella sp. HZ709 TaxID=2666328 RepID=UPI0012AEE148|nr:LysR family transcriptional regulator [Kangiella sp. HZ709]MRX26557.1 LysR family transcriptional regulator [Kangiella sp. HZ709]
MDLDLLRSFLALVRLKSFTLAAKELEITQPALTKRIKRLESIVGSALIDRDGNQLALTPAGALLSDKAPQIISDINNSIQEIRDLSGKISGQLLFATSHYLGLNYLPEYLKSFIDQYPSVDLQIDFIDSGMAYNQVLSGAIELALVTFPYNQDQRVNHIPIWQESMLLACHKDHALTKVAEPLNFLNKYDAILPPAQTFPRELFERNLKELDVKHGRVKTANYLEVIAKLVECKMGWTILPAAAIKDPLIALNIKSTTLRQMGIIHRNNKTLSNAARAFIDLLNPKSQVTA